jgi:hypothetical protein
MSTWLKAGLIGGVIVAVLNLIGLVPGIWCIIAPVALITYVGVGVLTALWMEPVRMKGPAAKNGALAGLVASGIGTGIGMVANVIKTALVGEQMAAGLPPEMQEMAASVGGAMVGGVICFAASLVFGVALGALGALVYAAVKPE